MRNLNPKKEKKKKKTTKKKLVDVLSPVSHKGSYSVRAERKIVLLLHRY